MLRAMGRKSTYTQAAADEICARVATGEPLLQVCRDAHMPAFRTVYQWLDANPEFDAQFARARETGHDAIAQECLDIADTTHEGETLEIDAHGKSTKRRGDMLGHRKLRIETRLKLLAKWDRRYSERTATEISNPDGSLTMTPTEREARVAAIVAKASQRKNGESETKPSESDVDDLV